MTDPVVERLVLVLTTCVFLPCTQSSVHKHFHILPSLEAATMARNQTHDLTLSSRTPQLTEPHDRQVSFKQTSCMFPQGSPFVYRVKGLNQSTGCADRPLNMTQWNTSPYEDARI